MRRSGLSLLETVLALAVLAMAFLSVLAVFTGSLQLMLRADQTTAATEAGRQLLERIKAQGMVPVAPAVFDGRRPDGTTGAPPQLFPPAPYPVVRMEGRDYYLLVETSRPAVDLVSVNVTVFWDRSQLSLETYLSP